MSNPFKPDFNKYIYVITEYDHNGMSHHIIAHKGHPNARRYTLDELKVKPLKLRGLSNLERSKEAEKSFNRRTY